MIQQKFLRCVFITGRLSRSQANKLLKIKKDTPRVSFNNFRLFVAVLLTIYCSSYLRLAVDGE